MTNVRLYQRVAITIAALCFSGSALAAPGWSATGLTVMPADAPKVVAAIDALFASKVGQKLAGRVVLRANLADGSNPETHTIVALSRSAAEREKTRPELLADPAWAAMTTTLSELSRSPGSTVRGMILYNSGDRSDSDVVWINHYLTVSDPGVLLNAMRTFSESPSGKAAPGQVHLSSVIAGGVGSASHVVSIGYESESEMEGWLQQIQADPGYRNLLATMQAVSVYHGATLQRDLKAWGKASVKDVTALGR